MLSDGAEVLSSLGERIGHTAVLPTACSTRTAAHLAPCKAILLQFMGHVP